MDEPLFRIYYDVDSESEDAPEYPEGYKTYDGDPFRAPALGVLAIVQRNQAHGRKLTSNFDYYVWKDNLQEWMGCDYAGMIDYLTLLGAKRILVGRMIPKEKFYKIVKIANEDPDFPERTGYYKEEVRPLEG